MSENWLFFCFILFVMPQCWNQRCRALRSNRWRQCSCGGCCRRPLRRSTLASPWRCRWPSRQSFWPASNRRARPTSARRSATLRPSSPATSSVTAPRRVTFKSWLLWRWALIWFLWSCDLDDDGNNQWPELLKFLFDSVNSDNVGLREAALHIFWWVTLYTFQILHWSVSTNSLASVHWLDSSVPSWKASFEDTVSIKHK